MIYDKTCCDQHLHVFNQLPDHHYLVVSSSVLMEMPSVPNYCSISGGMWSKGKKFKSKPKDNFCPEGKVSSGPGLEMPLTPEVLKMLYCKHKLTNLWRKEIKLNNEYSQNYRLAIYRMVKKKNPSITSKIHLYVQNFYGRSTTVGSPWTRVTEEPTKKKKTGSQGLRRQGNAPTGSTQNRAKKLRWRLRHVNYWRGWKAERERGRGSQESPARLPGHTDPVATVMPAGRLSVTAET